MSAKFSLNHLAVGTRFSGSFHPENESSYWEDAEDRGFSEWAETAQVGDEFPVAPGVYIARVE